MSIPRGRLGVAVQKEWSRRSFPNATKRIIHAGPVLAFYLWVCAIEALSGIGVTVFVQGYRT